MNGRLIQKVAILTAVLVFAGVEAAHSQTETSTTTVSRSKMTTADSTEDQRLADPSEADFTTDLRPIIRKMKLREGTNFVTETAEGLRVYAVVQITEIQVKDASGQILKGVKRKTPKRAGRNPKTAIERSQIAAPGGEAGGDDPRCWHCYDKGGQTHCFEIECPFLAAPGTGD